MNKALEKDRRLRYQNASDLESDLNRLRRDSTTVTSPRDGIGPPMLPSRRRWVGLGAAALAVVLAGALWLDWRTETSESVSETTGGGVAPAAASIAVLPFADMSPGRDQEYFSEGISEELLNLLARIPELRVTSRSSAFSFKGQNLKIREIAEKLHVAHVLEGSVSKAGDQMRIRAQLIEASSDTQLWSNTYNRTLDDVFAIQDQIASDVVAQLKVTLLGEVPSVEATDPEAYALTLQARHLNRLRTVEGFEEAIMLCRQALVLDPEFAAAWAELAFAYSRQATFGLRSVDETYRLARDAAHQALTINPGHAPAHAVLGHIAASYDRDLAAAAEHLEQALRLEPSNTDILGSAAVLAKSLGRLTEAIALGEYIVARDPVNSRGHSGLGASYYYSGREDEAIACWRTALKLSPGRFGMQSWIGIAMLLKGEPGAALEVIAKEPSEVHRWISLVPAHHSLGHSAESDEVLTDLIKKYERQAAYNIAYVLAYRGETDRAFEWLARAVEYNDGGLAEIVAEPLFAGLHSDERWQPFLASIDRAPDQLAAIDFQVTLPD